jgi:hypothetical protein
MFIAFTIIFIEKIFNDHMIPKKFFSKNGVNNFFNNKGSENLSISNTTQFESKNAVVYNSYSPFVVSGVDIGGWSFSVNIQRPKDNLGPKEDIKNFDIFSLYEYVTNGINEMNIPDLQISDKIYVNGSRIRDNKQFLENAFSRPIGNLAKDDLKKFIGCSANDIRHYKEIQIIDWEGELIVTIFLRFVKTSHSLFIESTYFLVPPLKEDFHKLDEIDPKLSLQLFRETLFKTLIATPFVWITSPFTILYYLYRPILQWQTRRTTRKLIRHNPAFNYGASVSVRDLASSSHYRIYFQRLDKDMHVKTVERHLLDLIVAFLDKQNIDTSDLRARQTAILNNGVIMTGGTIETENLAVGDRARAAVNRLMGQDGQQVSRPQTTSSVKN